MKAEVLFFTLFLSLSLPLFFFFFLLIFSLHCFSHRLLFIFFFLAFFTLYFILKALFFFFIYTFCAVTELRGGAQKAFPSPLFLCVFFFFIASPLPVLRAVRRLFRLFSRRFTLLLLRCSRETRKKKQNSNNSSRRICDVSKPAHDRP